MENGSIELRGVEVHNLKQVDLDIPRGKLVVFCGVSGSGKTSLALDTLYAEGQRRYIDSFSAFARQFLDRLEKPAARRIDGIPPAVAVTRKGISKSERMTVGVATETVEYLRLLFARGGDLSCHDCGRSVTRDTPDTAAEALAGLPAGSRIMIAFAESGGGGDESGGERARRLREEGFVRVVRGGATLSLDDLAASNSAADAAPSGEPQESIAGDSEQWHVVVDRLSPDADRQRMADSLETAFERGGGGCLALVEASADQPGTTAIDGRPWEFLPFSQNLRCDACGIDYSLPEPRLFSFNSPLGACPRCEGAGVVESLPCPACGGNRLRDEALAWHIGGKNIAQLCRLKISAALDFFHGDAGGGARREIAGRLLSQIESRLAYLCDVGLGYLSLDRPLATLSGGEAQRAALTAALGSSLVGMLYVLDEPTVGLHAADAARLTAAIKRLQERGNSVVVVEHEPEVIRAAGRIIEFGPEAGDRGGEIVFQGTAEELVRPGASLTGEFLAGRRGHSISGSRRRPPRQGRLRLSGASGHNLQNIDVEFPLGLLCVVSGVSGAGKSTLVAETLYGALCRRLKKTSPPPLPHEALHGAGQVDDVVLVDQDPIGRMSRSNPVTYVKAFDEIRGVFADTLDAKTRNYSASYFSFNVDGGRCPTCKGEGRLEIDMQFLADVQIRCDDCGGTRFRREILDILYRGKSIADVLEMTVREAFSFFRGRTKVQARLKRLIDVGLDYLRLGQPAGTLSGGEAQRLKLAGYLNSTRKVRTLFLLDEPTAGLHPADVVKLVDCFDSLIAVGHSLIVVEHNLQLIGAADWVIDLGPGAAEEGGRVVAAGTPEQIAQCEASVTGSFLKSPAESTG